MGLIFKRKARLGEFLKRENARTAFLDRVTKVFQEGLYELEAGEQKELARAKTPEERLEIRKLALPVQRARPITRDMWSRDIVERVAAAQAAGETITADQLSGLFPRPPAEVYRDELPIDDQFMSVFRVVQSAGASELYTKTGTTVEFQELAPGEEPELVRWSGTTVTLVNKEYGAMVGYQDSWLKDGRQNMIDEVTLDVKEAWAHLRATYFYGLISSVSCTSTAYATDWATSLNGAIARLIVAKRLGPRQTPVVVAPVEKAGELLQAVKDTLIQERGAKLTIIPDLVFTRYLLNSAKKLWVAAPKRHFIDQEREALYAKNDDGGALNISKTGYYGRFVGLIREATSIERLTWS